MLGTIESLKGSLMDKSNTQGVVVYWFLESNNKAGDRFNWEEDRSSHWRCSIKKVFLKKIQNSQENTCVGVSFLIKLQAMPAAFLKKRLWYMYFPVNFAKFLRAPFLQNTSGWQNTSGLQNTSGFWEDGRGNQNWWYRSIAQTRSF